MKYEQLTLFDVCPDGGVCTAESCEGCSFAEEPTLEASEPTEAKFEAPVEVRL